MEVSLPPLSQYARWVVDTVQSIGMSYGGEPLPNSEILAWCQLLDIHLTAWEIDTMKHLSVVYISSARDYAKDDAIPPNETEAQKQARIAKADQAARDSW